MLVFSLGWWSTRIPTGFLEPHGTWDTSRAAKHFIYRAITFYGHPSQSVWLCFEVSRRSPATPTHECVGLDCTRFARRYSGYLNLISFPRGTKMFQFPPFAFQPYFTQIGIIGCDSHGVSPFGYTRVNAYLAAHRVLSRPNSSFIASMSQGIHLVPWVAYRFLPNW